MNIGKIRKMTVKGVTLKSESFFLISPGVLELWRKNLRGADSAHSIDRVNETFLSKKRNFKFQVMILSEMTVQLA